MRSAEQYVGRPESIATDGKPFAMPSLARACDRDAAESLEDADVHASRFVARRCVVGSGPAWLHDRRQAPRRASALQRDEDGPAWWHRDDLSSPDHQASSELVTAPLRRTDGRGLGVYD